MLKAIITMSHSESNLFTVCTIFIESFILGEYDVLPNEAKPILRPLWFIVVDSQKDLIPANFIELFLSASAVDANPSNPYAPMFLFDQLIAIKPLSYNVLA